MVYSFEFIFLCVPRVFHPTVVWMKRLFSTLTWRTFHFLLLFPLSFVSPSPLFLFSSSPLSIFLPSFFPSDLLTPWPWPHLSLFIPPPSSVSSCHQARLSPLCFQLPHLPSPGHPLSLYFFLSCPCSCSLCPFSLPFLLFHSFHLPISFFTLNAYSSQLFWVPHNFLFFLSGSVSVSDGWMRRQLGLGPRRRAGDARLLPHPCTHAHKHTHILYILFPKYLTWRVSGLNGVEVETAAVRWTLFSV